MYLASSIDDLDELEVYGSEVNQSGSQVTQYTFEVATAFCFFNEAEHH